MVSLLLIDGTVSWIAQDGADNNIYEGALRTTACGYAGTGAGFFHGTVVKASVHTSSVTKNWHGGPCNRHI